MSIHAVKRTHSHVAWDNREVFVYAGVHPILIPYLCSIKPVIYVNSGDTIAFDCLDASNGQITPESTVSAIKSLDFSQLDQVSGPVFVQSATPGDTLQVDVISVETADWGWTALIPGFGLLHDEFPDPALKLWKLDTRGRFAWFDEKKRIKIPLRPFAGEMGVAPGKKGSFSTIPPYKTGGNIDTKHVTAGSTLYLPIEVEGALFSIGDGHAAQGDGEVCGTAIETPMKVIVRLTVRKDKPYVKTPHFDTPSFALGGECYCTTGVDHDVKEAMRSAVRHMIEFLMAEYALKREAAYMLCSVAGDLRMHEVVDMPNYVIGFMIPRAIVPRPARFSPAGTVNANGAASSRL